jgi:hypothetical protein
LAHALQPGSHSQKFTTSFIAELQKFIPERPEICPDDSQFTLDALKSFRHVSQPFHTVL